MSKSFIKRKKNNEDMVLQITSMADIFMILLVFLLKNYSTSVSTLAPAKDTKLPIAKSAATIKDTLNLEISSDSILVDAKPIVKLKKFDFNPNEVNDNGHSPSLFRVLLEERRRRPKANTDSSLLILADERTPYSTLKPVLASAASAGFVDLQLVVVNNE